MAVCDSEDIVDIVDIIVAEACHCQGMGRRLVRELADTLTARGMSRVRCTVLAENYVVRNWLHRLLRDSRFERDGETLTVHGTLRAP